MYQKILLCFGKNCCVSGNLLMFWKRLLSSWNVCCVLKKIVVYWKRLLCSQKDCCVSEQKLSCVLPLWATVLLPWRCTVICLPLTGKALFLFLGEMIPKLKSRQSKSSQSESSSQQQGAGASSKKKKGKKGKGKWNKTCLYLNNYFRERNKTMWPCTCILFSVFCNKGVVSTAS